MRIIEEKVAKILNGTDNNDSLKYLMYSSHDDSLANTLLFLNPSNLDLTQIQFAASLYLELHYDDECLKTTKNTSCFSLHAFHNNRPLKFDWCLDANQKRGSRSDYCLIDDFLAYYNSIKYQGDLFKACNQIFVPPSN
jgi:hypothetical protein